VDSLKELDSKDSAFLIDLYSTVQSLVDEFQLAAYRLIVNGGEYQDRQQDLAERAVEILRVQSGVHAVKLLAEKRRTTGAANSMASTWFEFKTRNKNTARGARAPGQNAEARRWSASPESWTAANGPEPAAA
jgi:hypothetical protein